MPRTRRQEVGDRTKARILDAAAPLIASQGYAATSISTVSAAAGVRPASIYWAFGSKEGLLAAVISHSAQRWLAEHRPAAGDAAGDVWDDIRSLARLFDEQPDFLRLLLVLSLERRDGDPAILDSARGVREHVTGIMVTRFEPVVPLDDPDERRRVADDLTRLLLMLLDGSFVARQIESATTDLDEMFDLVVDALQGALERRVAGLTAGKGRP